MFKPLFLAALMLLSTAPAFGSPPRMDALALSRSESGLESGCAPDKLCVAIAPTSLQGGCEGQACATAVADLSLALSGIDPAPPPYRLAELSSADGELPFQIWPKLIRFAGGVLAGVETQARAMYSGGGASSTTLHLIAFLPGQAPFEVLSVPRSANVLIRACFNERDWKQRAGACHDEYTFDAKLVLTGAAAAGMPVLRFRSRATSFPGPVSRARDSLAAPPLRKRDIAAVTDRRCSYQRLFRFSPETRAYIPDTPPPDCSDYTTP